MGATVSRTDKRGLSPLHLACQRGHGEVAALLLDFGAALDLEDCDGLTPLLWAGRQGHSSIMTLLLSRGANIEQEDHDGCVRVFLSSFTRFSLSSANFKSNNVHAQAVSTALG